jgi:hypothetical protein
VQHLATLDLQRIDKLDIQLKNAELSEIDDVLELHYRYHVDCMAEEDKSDGFVTTQFTKEQMEDLVKKENGLFIAKKNGNVVAYVMAASWGFWSIWPMFAFMIKELPNLEYHGQILSIENSYQYGPICIDKSVRGSGILEKIFEFAKKMMSGRFPILVTFVNKKNERSYQAHTRKLGLDVIQEFDFNGNSYYELVCGTSDEIQQGQFS